MRQYLSICSVINDFVVNKKNRVCNMECVIMARFNSLKFKSIDLACKQNLFRTNFFVSNVVEIDRFYAIVFGYVSGQAQKSNNNKKNKKCSHFIGTKAHFYCQLFSMHVLWASILNVSINVDFRILSRGYMLQCTRNQICIINMGSAHS